MRPIFVRLSNLNLERIWVIWAAFAVLWSLFGVVLAQIGEFRPLLVGVATVLAGLGGWFFGRIEGRFRETERREGLWPLVPLLIAAGLLFGWPGAFPFAGGFRDLSEHGSGPDSNGGTGNQLCTAGWVDIRTEAAVLYSGGSSDPGLSHSFLSGAVVWGLLCHGSGAEPHRLFPTAPDDRLDGRVRMDRRAAGDAVCLAALRRGQPGDRLFSGETGFRSAGWGSGGFMAPPQLSSDALLAGLLCGGGRPVLCSGRSVWVDPSAPDRVGGLRGAGDRRVGCCFRGPSGGSAGSAGSWLFSGRDGPSSWQAACLSKRCSPGLRGGVRFLDHESALRRGDR